MVVSERPTADLVLLIITGLIAASVLLAGAGLILISVLRPDSDLAPLYGTFGNMIDLLIGAVLGYLAGRGRSAQSKETI
jgi:hypothetical protein